MTPVRTTRPAGRVEPGRPDAPGQRTSRASDRREETLRTWTAAVTAAIDHMHRHLGEHQELRDLAQSGLMSPFHFHRVFQTLTAATPGRFLTALRMARARRLLLESSMSATDISIAVGYSSFGTFTTQFTKLVGLSPGRFRVRATAMADLRIRDLIDGWAADGDRPDGARGWIARRPDGRDGIAMVGLFATRIPQEPPTACAFTEPPGPVLLAPPAAGGQFQALAVCVAADSTVRQVCLGDSAAGLYVGAADRSVRFDGERRPGAFFIRLREPVATDPPLLVAFPLLLQPCTAI